MVETGEADNPDTAPPVNEEGERIHDQTCMNGYCHANNSILDERVPQMTDPQIYRTIDEGGDFMPPQNPLSDRDIQDVIEYLRTIY